MEAIERPGSAPLVAEGGAAADVAVPVVDGVTVEAMRISAEEAGLLIKHPLSKREKQMGKDPKLRHATGPPHGVASEVPV